MSNNKLTEKIIFYSLGVLLLFVAINAFGGGYYGMAGAKDVPTEWLKGSPFRNHKQKELLFYQPMIRLSVVTR